MQKGLQLSCAAYAVLRCTHTRLPPLELPPEGGHPAVASIRRCFEAARRALDLSIGEELLFPPVERISPELAQRLSALVERVEAATAQDVGVDLLGELLEAEATTEQRKLSGQHFTPKEVVELILALARAGDSADLLDPTCGTGAFLLRASALAAARGTGPRVWGCELDPLVALLARINLARFEPGSPDRARASDTAGPRVHRGDVLGLLPGADVGGRSLPLCDAVVGNLPYVRLHRQASSRWRDELGARWAQRDPELVVQSKGGAPRLRLSGQADLYALLFFHLADLVAPGGRIVVLTANSYLDADYGILLQRLFLRHFHVVAVVESRLEPWFADASVNTVITVLERPPGPSSPGDLARNRQSPGGSGETATRFVQLLRPLLPVHEGAQEQIPAEPPIRPQALAEEIERAHKAGDDAAQAGQPDEDPGPEDRGSEDQGRGFCTVDLPCARIRLVGRARLEADLAQSSGSSTPWSAYLRAPDVYFSLAAHPAMRPMQELATIRRGITTNCNELFYPPTEAQIEDAHLVPVVRSPRISRTIAVSARDLPHRLFVCHATPAELLQRGHWHTLGWIDRGRSMRNRRGVPIPRAVGRRPWYRLSPRRHRLLFTKTIHDAHIHRLLDAPAAVDQRLYGVDPILRPAEHPDAPEHAQRLAQETDLLAALLNCSLTALMLEVVGVASLGDGALDLPVGIVRKRLLLPDPATLGEQARADIIRAFEPLRHIPVRPVWQEVKRPQRVLLDRAILAGLALDVEPTLAKIHAGLCEMVTQRISLAKRRRTRPHAR